ncbi:MAG: hypothetical protein NC328_05980 [Muribaculum sp.]|nr:hypothetical protein [Muribaculum sp.]
MEKENLRVSADAVIKGNLRVEGWLEAPNVKGFVRGFYADEQRLMQSIPRPLAGWVALVGPGFPASVYVAEEGTWVKSGGQAQLSSPSVIDSSGNGTTIPDYLSQLLELSSGVRLSEPKSWIYGTYLSLNYEEVTKADGFRRSHPIELKPGECILVKCDSAGVAYPIAVFNGENSSVQYDFPPIKSDFSAGNREYRFTAEKACGVVISCHGEPERIMIWRRQDSKVLTRLYAANGTVVSCSRNNSGGRLRYDGSVVSIPGYGVSGLTDISGISRVDYNGFINAPEGDTSAFAVFIDSDGKMLRAHCCGSRPDGISNVQMHEEGELHLELSVPPGATRAIFGYTFADKEGTPNPLFEVVLNR